MHAQFRGKVSTKVLLSPTTGVVKGPSMMRVMAKGPSMMAKVAEEQHARHHQQQHLCTQAAAALRSTTGLASRRWRACNLYSSTTEGCRVGLDRRGRRSTLKARRLERVLLSFPRSSTRRRQASGGLLLGGSINGAARGPHHHAAAVASTPALVAPTPTPTRVRSSVAARRYRRRVRGQSRRLAA